MKLRRIISLGLVLALGACATAYADGASQNEAFVDGKVKPSKLDKKKYKPVNLLAGVRTSGPVPGINPEKEFLSFGKDIKLKTKAAATCSAPIEFQTTDAARNACPKDSYLGKGRGSIMLPGGVAFSDIVVSAFNGPGKNQIRLHTYSPSLEGATPTVLGKIVKSNAGSKFGQALDVEDAPDVAGDTGMITSFNTTISKKSKVVKARCKAKKFAFERKVTYDDGSSETASLTQKCKRKR
jgi:hypothetical protein